MQNENYTISGIFGSRKMANRPYATEAFQKQFVYQQTLPSPCPKHNFPTETKYILKAVPSIRFQNLRSVPVTMEMLVNPLVHMQYLTVALITLPGCFSNHSKHPHLSTQDVLPNIAAIS